MVPRYLNAAKVTSQNGNSIVADRSEAGGASLAWADILGGLPLRFCFLQGWDIPEYAWASPSIKFSPLLVDYT